MIVREGIEQDGRSVFEARYVICILLPNFF